MFSQPMDESDDLKEMIVKQYVTVREFSAAGAFIEKCKQNHQKTVQKKGSFKENIKLKLIILIIM